MSKVNSVAPKVSVILPVYNGEKFIAEAIQSVLDQTFRDFELIIIDDGSTDNTAALIKNFFDSRIIYIHQNKRPGLVKLLNIGLSIAKGKYIARIDADDVWIDHDKLKKQVDFLNKNEKCSIVGTGAIVVDETGKENYRFLNPVSDGEIRNKILLRNCFVHSSVMMRKSAVDLVGGYQEGSYSEDYHLWLKIGLIAGFANLPEYAVKYRVTSSGLSTINNLKILKNDIALVKEYKNQYPGRRKALFLAHLKLWFYGYFGFLGKIYLKIK